jgi:hypothetical protein
VDIGNVGSEAVGGVLVGEQASVFELPTKDFFALACQATTVGDELLTVNEEDDSLGL